MKEIDNKRKRDRDAERRTHKNLRKLQQSIWKRNWKTTRTRELVRDEEKKNERDEEKQKDRKRLRQREHPVRQDKKERKRVILNIHSVEREGCL